LNFSVYATVTGQGGAAFGLGSVPPRASCATSPASAAGYPTFGYPCFRLGVLPVVLLVTDEPPISPGDTAKNPDWSTTVRPAMLARGAKLVGIYGSGPFGNTVADLRMMASDTGAVDEANGNAPLVFDGSGANAPAAIQQGIQTLAAGITLDLGAILEDDPTDSVDAIAAFVQRIETLQLGTATCASGLTEQDTDGDAFPDAYVGVRAGTSVCWRLLPGTNTSIPPVASWRAFHATLHVVADGVTDLTTRRVSFVVPPQGWTPPAEGETR
jgi:hypothetical protein